MSILKANAWQKNNGTIVGTPLQTLSVTKSDVFTSTATTFTDITGLTITITPSSNTSKFLIIATMMAGVTPLNILTAYRLVRDSTPIGVGNAATNYYQATVGGLRNSYDTNSAFVVPLHHLDSPATTNPITYKIQGYAEGGTWRINAQGADAANSIWSTRGISTFTVMEIQA